MLSDDPTTPTCEQQRTRAKDAQRRRLGHERNGEREVGGEIAADLNRYPVVPVLSPAERRIEQNKTL